MFCRLGLVPRFFEFLSLEHSNNNVHNIRLCRLIISNADLTSVELADMQVADKVGTRSCYFSVRATSSAIIANSGCTWSQPLCMS